MGDHVLQWLLANWWIGVAWAVLAVVRRIRISMHRARIARWIRWWWPHLSLEKKENILRVWDAVAEAEDVRHKTPFGEQDPDRGFANIMTQVAETDHRWTLEMLHRLVAEHVVAAGLHRSMPHRNTDGRWERHLLPWKSSW